ncbi:MAG: NusG domain II-containing protein [Eubacterium sp.]|nr:NusG domain II-containing protein [Eubacterium sp.]
MKKKDIILVIIILLVAGIMYGAIQYIQSGKGEIVKIFVNGKVYNTYSLYKDEKIEIKTTKGKNTVWIHNGYVEMEDADCPDKYCEKQGKIKNTGETIVCLPHKLVVEIQKSQGKQRKKNTNSDVDAVAQ